MSSIPKEAVLTPEQAKKNTDMWVVNNGGDDGYTDVRITIKSGDEDALVTINAHYAPQNLTEQAPIEDIVKAPRFRRSHSAGHFTIVTPEWAQAALRTPEMVQEKNRWLRSKGHRLVGEDEGDEDKWAKVAPMVRGILERSDLTPDDIVASMRGMDNQGKIGKLEIDFVRFKSTEPKILEFINGIDLKKSAA